MVALTERKQVLKAGDTIDELVSQVSEPTTPMPNGTMHGKTDDLTVEGTGFMAVPTNEVVPTISGTAQVDATLTAHVGTWQDNNEPIDSYTYRWYRDGVFITGQTASTHVVVDADYGAVITVGVKAVNSKGTSAEAVSAGTTAVVAAVPINTVLPAISGTVASTEVLTCSTGTWDAGGGSLVYTYQWFADDVEIDGETNNTYTVQVGDIGAVLHCDVTATNNGGSATVSTADTIAVPS